MKEEPPSPPPRTKEQKLSAIFVFKRDNFFTATRGFLLLHEVLQYVWGWGGINKPTFRNSSPSAIPALFHPETVLRSERCASLFLIFSLPDESDTAGQSHPFLLQPTSFFWGGSLFSVDVFASLSVHEVWADVFHTAPSRSCQSARHLQRIEAQKATVCVQRTDRTAGASHTHLLITSAMTSHTHATVWLCASRCCSAELRRELLDSLRSAPSSSPF